MKRNIFIISSLFFALAVQLKADNTPFFKKDELVVVKKKKNILAKPDEAEKQSKQVIKLNLSQLPLTNVSLQYEYGFHKNMSGAIGFSFFFPRTLPSIFFDPSSNVDGYTLPKFSAFSITPEFRFYPGEKVEHQAPHGFYLAPYFRYSKYTLKASYIDYYNNNVNAWEYDASISYSGFTAGLMIGSQWIISKHFSIDWWILGGGAGTSKIDIRAKETTGNLHMSAQEQLNLTNDIQTNLNELGRFSNGAVNITVTDNSFRTVVKGIPMTSFRGFGLNLGFAF